MIFYTYEEKCALQGSAFIELQFCRAPADTDIKELVAVDSIENGRKDSLYVSDADRFYIEYGKYFDCGIYNSLKQGAVDIYGINYYAPALIDPISEKLNKEKPEEYEALAAWLSQAKAHNGFYIFGI